MRPLFWILALALCTGCARAEVFDGKVQVVVDGGIVAVSDPAGQLREVRLCGIDAPPDPAGITARNYLATLVDGKPVRVEGIALDDYGRTVGKVWVQPRDCPACGMTLDVNLAMITAGMACWRRPDAALQSPEDIGRYESAEQEARARRWGLWVRESSPDPQALSPGPAEGVDRIIRRSGPETSPCSRP